MFSSKRYRYSFFREITFFTGIKRHLACVAFVLGIALLSSLTSSFFSRLQLTYIISSDSDDLLNLHSMKINRFPDLLASLSQNFRFDCGISDINLLESVTYNDYVIKQVAIKTSGNQRCSSFPRTNIKLQVIPLVENYDENVSLWVAFDSEKKQNLLVAEWHEERGSLWVYMEPIVSDTIRNKYCSDCVLSAITSSQNPEVAFWRGDAALFSSKPLFSAQLADGLRVDTYVKAELLELYRDQLYLPLFIMGLTLGVLCVVSCQALARRKMSLHSLVERGLVEKEFVPYYQPIVDVSNNTLYGCEMLARWHRPDQDVISPMEFIPYVEKSGQILAITDQLIEKLTNEMTKLNWHATKQVISINVVPEQLESQVIMENTLRILQRSEIQLNQIAFEVTERKQFTDLAMASDVIEQLRQKGVDVKLDDAGTGYGGFSYIQQLNIRSLKIDKMFVENIGTTDIKLSLLNSIIAFGKEAGMEMIAEGVETEEQSKYLAEQGVYLQQGYFFGKPMIFKDFAYYCKSIQPKPKFEPTMRLV
ncbi:EAL domain-containing protein [Photobacterium sp. J15]|uniref:EAL domain-containing protein n=1 Tax=Photobacterium sp. J15 TaxID=265901 RepID=UPI000A007D0D